MGIENPRIAFRPGTGEWVEKPLVFGKTVIGRSSDANLPLGDNSLSRVHCQLQVDPAGIWLTDLGSSNGTFVQGKRLDPQQPLLLQAGQVFRAGAIQIKVLWENAADEALSPPGSDVEADQFAAQIERPHSDAGELPEAETFAALIEPAGELQKQLTLEFCSGKGTWEHKTLSPGEYILGRADEADLRLADQEVSRRHAKLSVGMDGTVSIMDMGSANGTQVDGNPLRPRTSVSLEEGQIVTIARFTLRWVSTTVGLESCGSAEQEWVEETMITPPAMTDQTMLLRYRQGNQAWQEYRFGEGEHIIGRSTEADISLQSNMVSRQHVKIMVKAGKVWITDLHSRNGVKIKGQLLTADEAHEISPGTSFTIDDFTFEWVVGLPVFLSENRVSWPAADLLEEEPSKTIIGAEMGIELDKVEEGTASAPINLAGHERVTIGRAPDNMIRLEHPLVSRYHAVIERMGTRTRIMDLHSANSLFVNGSAVDGQGWLKQGDTIKIGPYQIAFTGNELRASKEQSYNIDVVGLQKWVTKETNLLKDISLNIGQNEFVALVGMSGAGKSTLMDAINGFRPGTQGQVFVNGMDLYQNYNQFRDEIGNVPQRDIVHMELTARQALSYAAELRMPPDASDADRQKAVDDTLEDLGLTYRKDLTISRLSGGQIKRVSIGVELLTKPRLFFLDEPTSGLDPGTEYEMMKLLRRLADQGRTIMLITHATKNVMFCDKAIILANGGNLAFYGPPEEALIYFDQFRNRRERLEKDMEFDDIYRILEDPERGTPNAWRERYLQSPFARYTQAKMPGTAARQVSVKQPADARKQAGKRISSWKQLSILSRRYLRCMVQDKVSLVLTLSLAPILGLMNFIWGNKLFDPVVGNAAKTMGVWFAVTVMGILVGYMGSIQELVKEKAIYKRERAVGLKILSYILSKVWVGGALAFYQAFFILVFALLLVKPLVTEPMGYISMYVTLVLVIFSAFILGLVISAVSENANTAQLIMIGAFVPQLLLAGVLQPLHMIVGGEIISPIVEARWSFENFVNATGMGDPLVNDPCWSEFDRDKRNSLTNQQKDELCVCMGAQLFTNCAQIPGILSEDFYDAEAQTVLAMSRPEQPTAPDRLPTPTPRNTPTTLPSPTFMPSPTYLGTPTAWATLTPRPVCLQAGQSNCVAYQDQQQEAGAQMMEYQQTREAQFNHYRDDTEAQFQTYWEDVGDQMEAYKLEINEQIDSFADEERDHVDQYAENNMDIFEDYQGEMEAYSENLSYYERSRQEAISSAEAIIGILWDDYGSAFRGGVFPRMIYLAAITLVQFVLLMFLMKRKDTV